MKRTVPKGSFSLANISSITIPFIYSFHLGVITLIYEKLTFECFFRTYLSRSLLLLMLEVVLLMLSIIVSNTPESSTYLTILAIAIFIMVCDTSPYIKFLTKYSYLRCGHYVKALHIC